MIRPGGRVNATLRFPAGANERDLGTKAQAKTKVCPDSVGIFHRGPYRARTDDIHGVNVALYQLS